MVKQFFILAFLVSNLISAQTNYDQQMSGAFELWEKGKIDEASTSFELIASSKKDTWLPNYYVALVNTTHALTTRDGQELESLLARAQKALDLELKKHPENAELLVMQAMIHTARIAFDPMTNGATLSGPVMQLYKRAEAISPNNPRVVFNKAEFEMRSAQFFSADVTPMCTQIEKSILLFDLFKAESLFRPNWGKEQAVQLFKECRKS
jgi:hypothetical protein